MRIFITYSSKNRDRVAALADDLNAMGHTAWFDQELTGGQAWWQEILSHILDCDLYIFALTPEALDSSPCKLEYTYAHSLKKRILPILLSEVNLNLLPPELSMIQLVDYRLSDRKSMLSLGKAL